MTDTPILRSALSMPGSNARVLEKARALPCDCVIMDLEDAVAAESKERARDMVAQALTDGGFGHRTLVVRINPIDGPWGMGDLKALGAIAATVTPHAVLVPKVDTPEMVDQLAQAMADAGLPDTVELWIMVETAACVLALDRIAARAAETPLAALVLGANDLAKETHIMRTPGREAMTPVLSRLVLAARANGLVAIDSVLNAIGEDERLRAECLQGRLYGFDGKMLIHPSQIAAANAAFAPGEDALAEAQAIVDAFAAPENAGKAVVKVGGQMAEELHRDEALALIAKARAIAGRDAASS